MAARIIYEQELEKLNQNVLKMGTMLAQAIDCTSRALEALDPEAARGLIAGDDEIDRMEREIEQECIDLVVKQAPVASDWRKIAAIMRLIADLERIADHCSDISEYILKLSKQPPVNIPAHFPAMFLEMKQMAARTIESFVHLDVQAAQEVIRRDDTVDAYFEQVKEEICTLMAQNPEQIPQYVNYLMINKYIERMADHATNVAGWISFIVRGILEI